MKKVLMAAMTLVMAVFASCTNEDLTVENNDVKVKFTVEEKDGFGADSRAVKSGWETGDQILIVFRGTDGVLLVFEDNANTLKLTYDGTSWTVDDSNFPTSGLENNRYFAALHHPGNVLFGAANNFRGYNGGEFLIYKEQYKWDGTTLDLGEIKMGRNESDFQIFVPGIEGDEWELTILDENEIQTGIIHVQRQSLYFNTGSDLYSIGSNYRKADGVEYGNGCYFFFRMGSFTATKLLFKVANGIHGYQYTLDNVTTETLKGGNAYILPAITDSKWEFQY